MALSGADDQGVERIAIAAAFHDLGIWTDRTRLVQLELTRLRTHPWNPLPIVRL